VVGRRGGGYVFGFFEGGFRVSGCWGDFGRFGPSGDGVAVNPSPLLCIFLFLAVLANYCFISIFLWRFIISDLI